MRVLAALFVLLFSAGLAFGQGSEYVPWQTPAAKSKAKSKAKPTARSAKPKPAATARTPHARKPAARKPAARAAAPPALTPAAPAPAATNARASATHGPDATGTARNSRERNSRVKPDVRNSYAALSLGERIRLQSDLAWTGHYNGLVDGEFSDRLVAAAKAFQKRNRTKETGVLNPQERAALSATARPMQQEVGWRLLQDAATGARVGLPGRLAPNTSPGHSGTRWTSAQEQLQIETFRIRTGATLEAVFNQQKREPVGRRVSYSALKPDFFVVSGMQGLKKFYVRAAAQDGEVRGITILYDQAMEGTMDPIVVAMSSAFVPFANDPGATPVAGAALRRKVEYGTGVVVSSTGHIVTDRQAVEGCNIIVVPGYGNAERVGADKTGELAVIRLYGAHNLTPIGLIGAPPGGDAVTLVGIADPQSQGGGAAISTAPARLGPGAGPRPLDNAPLPGFSGAAAIDAQGHLAGVAVLKPAVVAGESSGPQAVVVTYQQIIKFLDAHYVAPATGKPGLEAAKASVVRVICVR